MKCFKIVLVVGILSFSHLSMAGYMIERLITGLDMPIYLTAPTGNNNQVFVSELSGNIKIYDLATRQLNSTPFFTGSADIIGMTFDPDYATNGHFYVNSNSGTQTTITRYKVSASNPLIADPGSATKIMSFQSSGHNGGWLGFGKDNFLYISTGDSGSGNGHDPDNNAQNMNSLLGKFLRIDVSSDGFVSDPDKFYSIPATNPYAGSTDGADEVWSFGLRNPWRASFDRETGDLFIADVGQDSREEINRQLASSMGGENYGWRLREGSIATPTTPPDGTIVGGPQPADGVDPIYEYLHGTDDDEGFSVTGGYMYRGPVSELQGKYFFADFVSEQIWSINPDGTGLTNWTTAFLPDEGTINQIVSFGEDAQGDLYVLDFGGEVFRLTSVPLPTPLLLLASALFLIITPFRKINPYNGKVTH